MANIDVKSIVAEIQAMYAKEKKVQSIVSTGDAIKQVYTLEDVIPLPEEHPLRQLMGLPGLPYDKVVQVAGKPDTGKSTWAMEAMISAQKHGVQVILSDVECKFDASRFRNMGGKPEEILLVRTNEILKDAGLVQQYIEAIKRKDPDAKILYVKDSVGAAQSRAHAERRPDDEKHAQPGQDAKENGVLMKMLIGLTNKYPDSLAVYLVNQCYAKIGYNQHGDATSGGSKIEYFSSIIVVLRRVKVLTSQVKGKLKKKGIITQATVTKNHLSQNATSIYKLNFEVTADGTKLSDEEVKEDDSDE